MDKIKGMADKAMNKEGKSSGSGIGGMGKAGGGQDDYVDKGVTQLERRTGHEQSSAQNEIMTDKGREMLEKQTGKKVPDKFSN